jgi:phospholipase C
MTDRRHLLLAALGALGGCALPRLADHPKAERAATPIEHIILILRENHSFNNYFAGFAGADGRVSGRACADEPDDPPHDRASALAGPVGDPAGRCHYHESQVADYWRLAREFTLCDRYFAEIRGPSVPNYMALMTGTAPFADNPWIPARGRFWEPTIVDRLDAAGLAWRNYHGGLPLVTMFARLIDRPEIVPEARFLDDARAGRLPAVAVVTPNVRDSEHPPWSVRRGIAWTMKCVAALRAGPQWPRCAVFIVWDEWGGFDDHVVPPVVERDADGAPLRYGYRVPCLVLGGAARRGHVSHTLYSHASLLRTIGRVFGLAPLTERDAAANDLLDCFELG